MVKGRLTLAIALLLVLAGCGQFRPAGSDGRFIGGDRPPLPTVDPHTTASTDVITRFLEPAPDGYAWRFWRDWDETIIEKCLVNALERDGRIELSIIQHLRSHAPPPGYWWTGETKTPPTDGPSFISRVCIRRLGCTYGKEPNSQECITPQ